MINTIKTIVAVTLLGSAFSAIAHHSFQATFASDAKIAVEGVVTAFSFRNPHIIVNLDVTNEDGTVTNWMSEGSAATLMRRAGWDKNTVKAGDLIRVHGDSTHDGSPMVSIDSIDVLDPASGSVVKTLARNAGRGSPQPPVEKAAAMPLTLDDGRPNLTGAWTNHGMRDGRPRRPNMAFTEAGTELQTRYDKANDPQIFCDPPGLVRQLNTPHPLRITQFDDRVEIDYEEYAGHREVPIGDSIPAAAEHTHFGNSVARYDGDALIIESRNLTSNPSSPEGNVLSDQTTTIEKYTRADSDEYGPVLMINVTVTDPANLSEPSSISRAKMSAGEYEFIENDCRQPMRDRAAWLKDRQ